MGQPPENGHQSPVASEGLNGVDNLDNLDNPVPKTSRTKEGHQCNGAEPLNTDLDEPLGVGDLVEITAGALMYKKAHVKVWKSGRPGQPGTVTLTHADWVVDPELPTNQVQLIQRARGHAEIKESH
jgi:hypothetical protein